MTSRAGAWWCGAALLLAACARSERESADTARPSAADAAGSASAASAASADSLVARTLATPPRPPEAPAREPDQALLRHLVDHHEGMIRLAHVGMERQHGRHGGEDPALLADATLDAEKLQMRELLRSLYGDEHEPSIPPADRAALDSILRLGDDAFDDGFRAFVVRNHRDVVSTIDAALPRLARPEVRALAERLRDTHARALAALEKAPGH